MKKAKGKNIPKRAFGGLVAGVYAPLRDASLRTRADPPWDLRCARGCDPLGTPYSLAINYQ